jgi:hypothetical protein
VGTTKGKSVRGCHPPSLGGGFQRLWASARSEPPTRLFRPDGDARYDMPYHGVATIHARLRDNAPRPRGRIRRVDVGQAGGVGSKACEATELRTWSFLGPTYCMPYCCPPWMRPRRGKERLSWRQVTLVIAANERPGGARRR